MLKKPGFTIAFFGWMSAITFLSLHSFSQNNLPSVRIPHFDKVVHAIFYFGAVVLGCLYVKERTKGEMGLKRASWFMCCVAIVYGILIEVLQGTLTAVRDGNAFDAMANALGAFAGVLVMRFLFSGTRQLKWKQ